MRRRHGFTCPGIPPAAVALFLLAALACSRGGKQTPAADTAAPPAVDASTAEADAVPATTADAPQPAPGTDTAATTGPDAATASQAGPDVATAGVDAAEDPAPDAAGLPAAEAELRRMLQRPCPADAPDAVPEPPAVFESELRCTGPAPAPEDEYEACERAAGTLSDRLDAQRAAIRTLLRDRKFVEARRALASWLNRHPCPEGCSVPPSVERLARAIEVAFAADGAITDLGGTWLERPVRVYVRDGLQPRTRPAGDARRSQGYPVHDNRELDVWGYVPDGWLLVADPLEGPTFRVREPPTAVVGWALGCRLSLRPTAPQVTDVGHPIAILRPPAAGAAFDDPADGKPCSRGGKPGREYALWADERSECFPYGELCGGPGLTPPSWELRGPDEDGCGDCCTNGRSMVQAGDWCRAREPGWVWRCSADHAQLECGPPPES